MVKEKKKKTRLCYKILKYMVWYLSCYPKSKTNSWRYW
jgi:hypothetical protein